MQIESKTGVIRLVKQAQWGDSEAMSQLSQQVADRVLPYIQGLTLNYATSPRTGALGMTLRRRSGDGYTQ